MQHSNLSNLTSAREAITAQRGKIQAYSDAHEFDAYSPQNPLKLALNETEEKCRQLNENRNAINDLLASQHEKQIGDILEAITAYYALIDHLLSVDFYQETLRLYFNTDAIQDDAFVPKKMFYDRLNKNLDLVLPIVADLAKFLEETIGDKNTDEVKDSLYRHQVQAYAAVNSENDAIKHANTATTACAWTKGIFVTLFALGSVASIALGCLILAGAIVTTFPWLAAAITFGTIAAFIYFSKSCCAAEKPPLEIYYQDRLFQNAGKSLDLFFRPVNAVAIATMTPLLGKESPDQDFSPVL